MIKATFLITSLISFFASSTFAGNPVISTGAKHCINQIKQKEGLTSKEQIERLARHFNVKQQFNHCLAGQKMISTEEPEEPTPEERYLLCMAACSAAYGLGSPYFYLCMLFCE